MHWVLPLFQIWFCATLTFTNSVNSTKSGFASVNKHLFLSLHTDHNIAKGTTFQISFTWILCLIPDHHCRSSFTELGMIQLRFHQLTISDQTTHIEWQCKSTWFMVSTSDLQNTHSGLALGFNTPILSKKFEDLIIPLQASQLRNCTLGWAIFLQMFHVISFVWPLNDSTIFHTNVTVKDPEECASHEQESSTKAFRVGALYNKLFILDSSSTSYANRKS